MTDQAFMTDFLRPQMQKSATSIRRTLDANECSAPMVSKDVAVVGGTSL